MEKKTFTKALTKRSLHIFWSHAWKYPIHVFVILIGAATATAIDVYKPFLYKDLFNALAGSGASNAEPLFHIAFQILIISIIHWAIWRAISLVNNYFQPRVMSDLLNTCYEYIHGHSYNYFNNSFVGSLVTKIRRYQKSFEDVADQVSFNMGRTFLNIFFILTVLFYQHWQLGLAVLVWCVIFVAFAYLFSRFKLKYDIRRADMDTKTTAHLADTITNNLNLKLFTSSQREITSFKEITDKLFKIRKLTWDLAVYSEMFQGGFMVLLEFGVIYMSIKLWQKGQLTIGDFALIQAYLLQIFDKLWDLGRYIRGTYESLADADEMTAILETKHEIVDVPNASLLKAPHGAIDFQSVVFNYNTNRNILDNFNLSIQAGKRIAFIGPSGGGKSTIVKLLFRFHDIQEGRILIDGQDISQATQESLREHLALVPQEPILFHRSLMENIRYARPEASDEEVKEAAKLAHCHEFISQFPDTYNTLVGERGVKLSGGERQRVAIARAILKNAPILVLDEATSSLDSESEHYIQEALKTLMKGRTTIVVAHRLSTIMQMDRIVVIENGKIKEQGKHEELLKVEQGLYQKLWGIQAGGFAG